jgi:gluconolactonase
MEFEMVTDGPGWPEGPTVLPNGRMVFVESYRGQLTVVRPADAAASRGNVVLFCG